ncbi:hypothetical protein HMI54_001272 [Coelomomyces lativittatus]|nr:hypothetical protein HMI55_006828 [Coelomomyces lativittatus]KAJ1510875.1 hypothetical protein HMI54_001272 [Coelomomyces lativittatus]KAJ1513660.1 hypothetical protein HMI56_002010 [Coelomomyces lativittatus]
MNNILHFSSFSLFLFLFLVFFSIFHRVESGDVFYDGAPLAFVASPLMYFNLQKKTSYTTLWSVSTQLKAGWYRFQALVSGGFQDASCWQVKFHLLPKPFHVFPCSETWVTFENGDMHYVNTPFGLLTQVPAAAWSSLHTLVYIDASVPYRSMNFTFQVSYSCTDTETPSLDFIYLDTVRFNPVLEQDPVCEVNLFNFKSPSLSHLIAAYPFLHINNETSLTFQPTTSAFKLKFVFPVLPSSTYQLKFSYSLDSTQEPSYMLLLQSNLTTSQSFTFIPGAFQTHLMQLQSQQERTMYLTFHCTQLPGKDVPTSEITFHHIEFKELCGRENRSSPPIIVVPEKCIEKLDIQAQSEKMVIDRKEL